MKKPEALYRKRYRRVLLLFEEDIKGMLDLFTAHCQYVDVLIDGKARSMAVVPSTNISIAPASRTN